MTGPGLLEHRPEVDVVAGPVDGRCLPRAAGAHGNQEEGACHSKADPRGHLVPIEQPPPHAKEQRGPGLASSRASVSLVLSRPQPSARCQYRGGSKGRLLQLPCRPPGPALASLCSVGWGLSSACPGPAPSPAHRGPRRGWEPRSSPGEAEPGLALQETGVWPLSPGTPVQTVPLHPL